MTLLALCLVVTFVGPLLAKVTRRSQPISEAVDSFIVVTLAGLVLFHLVPQGLAVGGFYAGVAGLFGLALPTVLERFASSHKDKYGRRSMLLFALSGLLLHALLDGAALGLSSDLFHHEELATTNHDHGEHHHDGVHGSSLFLGVLLHRLPVALGVFWMGSNWRGPRTGWLAIIILAIATSLGFGLAGDVLHTLDSAGVAVFQTFVAASLLHVLMDTHSPLHHSASGSGARRACPHHHHHHERGFSTSV